MPTNLEVVQAWVQACNQRDVECALSLCSPSMELVESETLPGPVRAAGLHEVRRYLERFATHWTDGEWLAEGFLESGDNVVMMARLRLRGRKSGIEVDRHCVYLFTLRDGKLLSQQGFDGRAEALQAAGVQ
jgi:ketosteroid isomerase-like protein